MSRHYGGWEVQDQEAVEWVVWCEVALCGGEEDCVHVWWTWKGSGHVMLP